MGKNGLGDVDGLDACPACKRHGFESHLDPIFSVKLYRYGEKRQDIFITKYAMLWAGKTGHTSSHFHSQKHRGKFLIFY